MSTYSTNSQMFEEKADKLKAIANPSRLCIINTLRAKGTCNVSEMQACLDSPQSTVSQHISKLKAARIITGERKGKEIYYSLVDNEIENIVKIIFCK